MQEILNRSELWNNARDHPPEDGVNILGIDQFNFVHQMFKCGNAYFYNLGNDALPVYVPEISNPIWWIYEHDYLNF